MQDIHNNQESLPCVITSLLKETCNDCYAELMNSVIKDVKVRGNLSKNGRIYLDKHDASKYENVHVYLNHCEEERKIEDKIGWLQNCYNDKEGNVFADLCLNPKHPFFETFAGWLEVNSNALGLSHNALCKYVTNEDGTIIVHEVLEVTSVDIVDSPATTKGLFESYNKGNNVDNPIDVMHPMDTGSKGLDKAVSDFLVAILADDSLDLSMKQEKCLDALGLMFRKGDEVKEDDKDVDDMATPEDITEVKDDEEEKPNEEVKEEESTDDSPDDDGEKDSEVQEDEVTDEATEDQEEVDEAIDDEEMKPEDKAMKKKAKESLVLSKDKFIKLIAKEYVQLKVKEHKAKKRNAMKEKALQNLPESMVDEEVLDMLCECKSDKSANKLISVLKEIAKQAKKPISLPSAKSGKPELTVESFVSKLMEGK